MVAAVRIHKTGGPEVLTYEDIELKEPGQGEVRIKHSAIGLNFIDTYFRTGLYPAVGGLPMIPGNEGSGVVTALGCGRHRSSRSAIASLTAPHRAATRPNGTSRRQARQAARQHRRQDRGRHDAEGPHRAISPAAHLQGRKGKYGARPRRRRRRRPHSLPMGESSRRHRDRHRRFRRQGGAREEERRAPYDPLSRRGLRRARRRDHQRCEMRRGL
jgi:hypothetical protein